MLTWAMVYLTIKTKSDWASALPFVIAIIGDVMIFYYISEAVRHSCQ